MLPSFYLWPQLKPFGCDVLLIIVYAFLVIVPPDP